MIRIEVTVLWQNDCICRYSRTQNGQCWSKNDFHIWTITTRCIEVVAIKSIIGILYIRSLYTAALSRLFEWRSVFFSYNQVPHIILLTPILHALHLYRNYKPWMNASIDSLDEKDFAFHFLLYRKSSSGNHNTSTAYSSRWFLCISCIHSLFCMVWCRITTHSACLFADWIHE